MKKIIISGLFLILLFSNQISKAQSESKALIKGVVTEMTSKSTLPGANIVVEGTYNGTTTNHNGEYSLYVEPGKFEIVISYIGNKSKTLSVEVAPSQTKVINISLEASSIEIDDIIITGVLGGQKKALNQQKASNNLKSVISSDQMGNFPDQNSAESLQRIQGISVLKDEGDGRFVMVRGLSPAFTNISINGEQIPSPESESRFVALDAIPSNQLASIEVSKSITPDMDGDAIGGSINLITPTASSPELSISGSSALEYNNSSQKPSGLGSLTISKRSENDKFGFILSGSYSASKKHSERYKFDGWDDDESANVLDEVKIYDYEIDRTRIGFNSTIDYKINDKNKIYFRTLYSELRELEQRRSIAMTSEYNDVDLVTDYEMENVFKYRPENQGVYNFNLGGVHENSKFTFDYEAAFSQAFQITDAKNEMVFENAGDVSWIFDNSNRLSPQITGFTFDGNSGADMNDASMYEFKSYEVAKTLAEDMNITAKFNLAVPIKVSKYFGEIKFGGKVRMKEKSFEVQDFEEYEYAGAQDMLLNSFDDGLILEGFMDGELNQNIGMYADRDKWNSFYNSNIGDFENDAVKSEEEKTLESYTASEDIYAGYLQGKIQMKKMMILGGVRYENTMFEYTSGVWDEDIEAPTKVNGENDYGFLLPMLHLKYTINDNNIIRSSITKSYSRPNFQSLVQGATYNDEEAEISNPDLVPVEALNIDLFSEHYLGSIGLLSGGVFYKKLDNFIYQQTIDGDFAGYQNIKITQSINGDEATLYGIEIGYQQDLNFLPSFLKGFIVYVNYTYTKSNATVQNFSQDLDLTDIQLPGQAENIGNAALAYAYKGFKARFSVNYVDSYIKEFDGGDLVILDNRTQLDFSMSQTFAKKKWTAYMELVNLTDANQVELYNTSATPKQREHFGFWGRLGLRFNF
ncbi:MAG: TonB-dependent receptor [Bacteroidales bacterium]|nr:TonB-dependent receptor [Bacteroidales bacterium]